MLKLKLNDFICSNLILNLFNIHHFIFILKYYWWSSMACNVSNRTWCL